MTKTYLLTEAQLNQLVQLTRVDLHKEVKVILQSLSIVRGEPVAHMYPWDLERFATNETTAHAYSVSVGCPDGTSVPLYTSPQPLQPITADDVPDSLCFETGEDKEKIVEIYNAVIKHRSEEK